MNYDVCSLDHSKYYYFIDDNNKLIEVDKSSKDIDLDLLKNKYFFHNGSRTFNILFGLEGESSKNEFFKYLIVDFGKTNISTQHQIIALFNDLLQQCDVIELKDKIVIVYYKELDLDFNSIMDSINLDFFTSINMYNSGKTYYYRPNHFSIIFNLIVGLGVRNEMSKLTNTSRLFLGTTGSHFGDLGYLRSEYILNCSNNVSLVLLLVENNSSSLKKIRPILLNKVNDDSQCEKIIFSMLKNNLNVSNAAKDLFMHRNTLNNKLDYIRSETGFNIQRFIDAMAMFWLINAK